MTIIITLITVFVNITNGSDLQLTAAVYSVITLIVNGVFVRFMTMKLKYVLVTLLVEYSTFSKNIQCS